MENNLPPLPVGPVICESCANAGRKVEMQSQPAKASYEATPSLTEGTNLQSYRCSDCESISVFRVD